MANTETAETPQDCRCTKSGAEMLACACRRHEHGDAVEHPAESAAAPPRLPADDERYAALDRRAGTPTAETPA